MSNSEQCSNRLELDLISLLVNFSYELGQIMARFDFLWPRWVIVSNHVQTDFQLCIIDHVLLDSGALRPKGLLYHFRTHFAWPQTGRDGGNKPRHPVAWSFRPTASSFQWLIPEPQVWPMVSLLLYSLYIQRNPGIMTLLVTWLYVRLHRMSDNGIRHVRPRQVGRIRFHCMLSSSC